MLAVLTSNLSLMPSYRALPRRSRKPHPNFNRLSVLSSSLSSRYETKLLVFRFVYQIYI